MPRYFFDTSALVKHYHTEPGSPKVDSILGESGSEYLIARLTLAETQSVFAKQVRTGKIADGDFDRLRLRFFADVRLQGLAGSGACGVGACGVRGLRGQAE